jgi:hypothetical protein
MPYHSFDFYRILSFFISNPPLFGYSHFSIFVPPCFSKNFFYHINPFSLALSHVRNVPPFVILARLLFICTLCYQSSSLSKGLPLERYSNGKDREGMERDREKEGGRDRGRGRDKEWGV